MNYKQYNEELIEENYKLREENTHLSMLNCDLEMYLKEHKQIIDKAIEYIKKYGRDKQLEEEYLMNAYNLAMYNITLLEILGDKENE